MAYNDFNDILEKQRRQQQAGPVAALAQNAGMNAVQPVAQAVAPVRSLAQRAFPNATAALSGEAGQNLGATGNVFNVMGRQARGVGQLVRAGYSDVMGDASAAGVNALAGAGSEVAAGVAGASTTPPVINNTSEPGSRVATPTSGTQSAPIAPVTPPATGPIAQMARPGDAQVASMNAQNTARGNGITASRETNGTLALTNIGANGQPNASTPQNTSGQGYDLRGDNERRIAARDTANKIDMQGAIASLVSRAKETNDPRQEASLLAQAQQLQSGMTTNAGAIATAGLSAAQAGQATATTEATRQTTAAQAASAKKMNTLHDQYINAKNPEEAKILGDKLLVMGGKDPKAGKFTVALEDEPIDPSNPMMGTKKVAYFLDNETGTMQRAKDAAAAGKLGGKPPEVAASKYVEGQSYTDANGNKAVYKGGKFVPA